jgi:hypothetical protein
MTERATNWSVTINNPTASDDEAIAQARQKGWTVDGQLEKGDQGTPHYQLAVRTPQVRFSQVKKAFPRAHIEIARNVAALQAYVHKSDTQIAPLPVQSALYPSLSKLWDLIYDRICDEVEHPADDLQPSEYTLDLFDKVIYQLITDGYHVETMAVNPQVRGCFLKFGKALMIRSFVDRPTRPTTQNLVLPTIIPDADEKEDAQIP